LTPLISLIFIHTLLGEQIFPQTYAGVVLIFSGIVMQKLNEFKGIVSQ